MTDWDEILAAHGQAVWRTVYRLVGNEADAADCFQEAFVSAWQYAQRQSVTHWPGLLRRMATARALDRLRAKSRRRYLPVADATAQEVADNGRPPAEIVAGNELFQRLREAMAELPPAQAEACCLRFLEEQSYDEIARSLGVSVNHVGVLLSRGRAALREQLAEFAPLTFVTREQESES